MKRTLRLALLEKIVRENIISSQEELLRLMEREGMKSTQATLSRDLKLLGIVRGLDGKGGYRYLLPGNRSVNAGSLPLQSGESITGMTWARGLLLINTPPGFAPAVAVRIDRAGRYEIAGTVAGDDTILLVPRDSISNEAVEECLSIIFNNNNNIKR